MVQAAAGLECVRPRLVSVNVTSAAEAHLTAQPADTVLTQQPAYCCLLPLALEGTWCLLLQECTGSCCLLLDWVARQTVPSLGWVEAVAWEADDAPPALPWDQLAKPDEGQIAAVAAAAAVAA